MPIGRQWPKRATWGDFSCECDICGVVWRRSELIRKADGFLYCPDDAAGRDIVTLNEGNAAGAAQLRVAPPREDGGTLRQDVDASTVVDVATVVERVTFGQGNGH